MRLRGRAAAVVAGASVIALASIVPATTATADDTLSVTVDKPVVDGSQANVSGTATMADPLGLDLDRVTDVAINVTPRQHGGPSRSCNGCGADLGHRSVSFSFTASDLTYNGPYDITVDVSGRRAVDRLSNVAPVSTSARQAFNVEVDPAPPADVSATANADGSVTVTWSRNSEPDLVGYQVQRRGPGGSGFEPVGSAVTQPPEGSKPQWTDTTVGSTGGQFEYRVVAVRPDGDGAVTDRATSASSGAGVTVPGPAGPGGPAAGGPDAVTGPGPGGAFTAGSPSSLDLSSFLAAGGTPPTVPGGEPDGTFSATLPFGAKDEPEMGSGSVEILGRSTSRRSLLIPIATGLLLCLVALHLRRFNRRVFAPPLET
ncbi:MAG: fibronectin type III domain-containing protein [Actinomycetota bacterium]|nr:fibronectin type III domain-containing protein [Actinomycetota bacterium]